MLFGKYPFDGSSDSEILNKISQVRLTFPTDTNVSVRCKQIIIELLKKNPIDRLDLSNKIFNDWYMEMESDLKEGDCSKFIK